MIRNVQLRENEGLYADFWFNPKHSVAEQLLWDAEHASDNVGFSHNVEAVVRRQTADGRRQQSSDGGTTAIVERIVAVRSVDLVADPATTRGLFESIENASQGEAAKPITLEQVERLIEERLQQFQHVQQRETKPQSRGQIVTDSAFDSKAFAAAITK